MLILTRTVTSSTRVSPQLKQQTPPATAITATATGDIAALRSNLREHPDHLEQNHWHITKRPPTAMIAISHCAPAHHNPSELYHHSEKTKIPPPELSTCHTKTPPNRVNHLDPKVLQRVPPTTVGNPSTTARFQRTQPRTTRFQSHWTTTAQSHSTTKTVCTFADSSTPSIPLAVLV